MWTPTGWEMPRHAVNELAARLDELQPAVIFEYGSGRRRTLHDLWPHLADQAEVWLDDADRPRERQSVAEWSSTYPLDVSSLGRVAVLRK